MRRKKRSKVVYLKNQIRRILFYGKLENWDWTLIRDTPWNSQDAPGTKLKIREWKGQSGGIVQKRWTSWAKSLRVQYWEETPEETSLQADLTSKVAWNLARIYASSEPNIKTTFYSLVKAPETQKIVCSLWIWELQCTMLSKENGAQTQWILWQGPKHHKRLAAIGSSADERVSTSFCSWSRSVRNSAITRWNASNSIASSVLLKTRIFIWVENNETPQLAQIVKTMLIRWATQYFSLYQDCRHIPAAFLSSTSRSKEQSNFQKIENIVRSSDNSKWQACMRETVKQQTRRTRKIQRKAFLFGYSPSQWIWRTWRHFCSHIPLKERTQIRKVMLQKWRHKNGSTVFMLYSAKTKRDLFCEQKSMVTW